MEALGKGSIAWWLRLVLDVSWFLMLFFFVLLSLATIVAVIAPEKSDMEIELPIRFEHSADTISISAPEIGVDRAELANAKGKLKFPNPGGFYGLMLTAYTYLHLVIALIIVSQLRKIFHSLARHEPFDAANARRLRRIGLAIIAGQGLGGLMNFGFTHQLERVFVAEGLRLTPDWGFNLFGILISLMILVIAEVFRLGAEMKEEQDLTV